MSAPRIRDMTAADAPRVAALLGQLGYPSAADGVPARLKRMAGERRTIAIVAEDGDAIAGLAAGQIFHAIHADEPVAYLMALVVDESARGSGVGRALVCEIIAERVDEQDDLARGNAGGGRLLRRFAQIVSLPARQRPSLCEAEHSL